MDIFKIAKDSGFQIILDGRIGQQEYRSVIGTLDALLQFAAAVRTESAGELPHQSDKKE